MVAQGLTVNDAAHGEEALERLRDDLSDVILRDLKVPRMGGTEACREIWGASEVPIIVVSVSSSRDVLTTQRAAYGPL
jgi:CheY-like chemotaxis protein